MKDLTTYFQRSTTSTPQLAQPEESMNHEKFDSSKGRRRKKTRSTEGISDVTSDDANEDHPRSKLRKTTKTKSSVSRNKDTKRESRIINSSDNDTDHDEKIVRKKSRKKSAVKSEKRVNKLDGYCFTDNSQLNSTDSPSPADGKRLCDSVRGRIPEMRTLKGVLLKDCLDSSNRSEIVVELKQTSDGKRKNVDSDESDGEKTDSSGALFNMRWKSGNRTYGKAPRIREARETNNLFNYFKKTDKMAIKEAADIEDSPVNCLKQVKVVVQVHSPPKVRRKLSKPKQAAKENMSPIVKIVRADVVKSFNFDDIKVVRTEYAHFDDVNGDKNKTDREIVWRTEKCKSIRTVSEDSDSDSAAVFNSPKRSGKLKVRNEASSADDASKSPKGRFCKRVSFAEHGVSPRALKNTPSKSAVKNRVSFSNTCESRNQSAMDTCGALEVQSSLEKSKSIPKNETSEAKKRVPEASSQSKSSGNDSDSSCKSSSSSKLQPWKMRVKFVSSGKPKALKKTKPKNQTAEETIKKEPTSVRKVKEEDSAEDSTEAEYEISNVKTSSAKNVSRKYNEDVVETREPSSPKRDTSVIQPKPKQMKLAPLFYKQVDKTKKKTPVDTISEARRLFLDSGLPDVIKKKLEEQKSFSNVDDEKHADYRFPKITHVQQKTDSFVWTLPVTDLGINPGDDLIMVPESSCFSTLLSQEPESKADLNNETSFDFKYEVTALKRMEPNINVADICSSVKRLFKEAECSDNNICWTDKYKPAQYEDLIGNAACLLKLKEWIESHKRLKSNVDDGDSSSDEFVDSDDSSGDITRNNIAMLVGPPGCGKTCAVYMLANVLGFKVLEVNAATNRNGKRILDELLEATQSHRVKRTVFDQADKNPVKKKKKKKDDERRHEKRTMSLILIEDADILFENYDDGFLSALSSLAARSKRPLVFTMNGLNYPHLAKYNNARNLILKFAFPSRSLMCVWLKMIALTEGVKLSDEVLTDLFHVAGLDVRKSLLQLQMLISSKMCYSKLNGEQMFYNEWWRVIDFSKIESSAKTIPVTERKTVLFSPGEDGSPTESSDSETKVAAVNISIADQRANRKTLTECAAFLETVAVLNSFGVNQYQRVISPGTQHSLVEVDGNNHSSQLSADVAGFLKTKLFSKFSDSNGPVSFENYFALIRKTTKTKTVSESTLSYLKLASSDSCAKYCDYLPTIRAIARIEDGKQNHGLKRSNRYFSYLKSINIDISNQETDFLRESFI